MIWSFPISNCLSKSIEPCFATTKIILFTYLKKKKLQYLYKLFHCFHFDVASFRKIKNASFFLSTIRRKATNNVVC